MPTPLATRTTHAGLPDGELRVFPFRRLTVGTRQRGANEAAVNRTLVVGGIGSVCFRGLFLNRQGYWCGVERFFRL
jgi:hypothetical protein